MEREVTLKKVPADRVQEVVDVFKSQGAKVTTTPDGQGTFTVVAVFKDWPDAADDGEPDRPSRRTLETSKTVALHYPAAKLNVNGEMKTQGKYRKGYPEGAVVHFTAGRDDPRSDIRSALENGYCYFVIAPNGDVYQNFALDSWGYHAGKSSHPELGSGVSRYLVGIEICCSGGVRELPSKRYRPWYNEEEYLAKYGRKPRDEDDLSGDQVRHVKKEQNRAEGWYEKYTPLQEAALVTLLRWLQKNNPDVFQFDLVLGHDEVAPGRKTDPGGALSVTMPSFRTSL